MVVTSLSDVKKQLTPADIIRLLNALGANLRKDNDKNYLAFDTVCHHKLPEDYKPKLYYYINSRNFHCFSSCQHIGDVFKLVAHVLEIKEHEAIEYVLEFFHIELITEGFEEDFEFDFVEAKKKKEEEANMIYHSIDLNEIEAIPLPPIKRQGIIHIFSNHPCVEWLREGISEQTMKKYDIKFSLEDSSIVIPHHNIHGKIVGIRNRNLIPSKIRKFGKYVPMFIYGKMYSHPIGENLYGLDKNKEAIKKYKRVVIFEGEKSVLQMDSVYGDKSIGVAVCGSSFSRFQMKMLLDLGVEEFIFAFDKQYENEEEEKEWSDKIYRLAQPLLKFGVKVTKIWDNLEEGLLGYKNSPFDKGGKVYSKLVKNRVEIKLKGEKDDKTQIDFTE